MNYLKNMKKLTSTQKAIIITGVMSMVLMAANAFAITTPTVTTSFGYSIYDLVVVQGLQGPIGFVAGCFCIIAGVITGIQNKILAAASTIIFGGILLGAPAIVATMGVVF